MTIKKKEKKLTLDKIIKSIPEDFQYPDDVASFAQSGPIGREVI